MRRQPLFHPRVALSMAWRGLRRSPGTSGLAVTILALGLAAPVVFFSLLVGAIRPLPVPAGEDMVRVDVVLPARGGAPALVAMQDLELLQGASSLESLGAFRQFGGTVVDEQRAAVRIAGAALTPSVLPMLRVEPMLGRVPSVDEAETTVLLGHDVWQEAYDGDPGALGRTVELDGTFRTVVGIMPEGFGFPFNNNTWIVVPVNVADPEPVELVGRLARGNDLESAETELSGRWARGEGLRAPEERGAALQVQGYTGGRGEGGEAVAFLGLVLVALALLLIACANVANLLLVRATERVRALGIQSALGAGRVQIGAQLLLEALLLSLAGGMVGLFLADLAVDAIEAGLAAEHFGYFWMRMAVDGRVLAFAGVLVVGTALVAGTLPVFRVWHVDVQRVLKEEGGTAGMGGGGMWSRAFVTIQLALSCAALVAAGLSARSLGMARDFGGELPTEEILIAGLDVPTDGMTPAGFVQRVQERVGRIAAVEAVSLGLGSPGFSEPYGAVELDGVRYDRPEDRPRSHYNAVTPDYFQQFGVDVLTGRGLAATDAQDAQPVAVVSESFARRHASDGSILGRGLRLPAADTLRWYTVVGVVADLDVGGGERAPRDRVYVPLDQLQAHRVILMALAQGDAGALAGPVREAVADVAPHIALWQVRTLADIHAYLTRVPRAMSALALAGGVAGLFVAAVGLYGLLAFRVRQRRRDLGVHLALGADGRRLATQTLVFGLRQVLPALVVGLLAAWLVAPILGALLMGLDPRGVDTYVGVALAFLAVSLVASALPAVRAARVDPARVLRGE